MRQVTRKEILQRMRKRCVRAGKAYRARLITEVVELLGYHRKAAIRALQTPRLRIRRVAAVLGRPKCYDPTQLLRPLKAIWLAALQPCGKRLAAALPEWVPAYESYQGQLPSDTRQSLLQASAATLDRLLRAVRAEHRRQATTRPGTILRQRSPCALIGMSRSQVSGDRHGGLVRRPLG